MKQSFSARLIIYLFSACLLGSVSGLTFADDEYNKKRMELIRVIEDDVRETSLYLDKEELDARVMKAMADVPRHEFVRKSLRSHAYENRPLPIGYGQTISQPYIVAIMTDLIKVKPGSRVLEIGTGSGYQAAILAELVDQVFTIEIIEPLSEQARALLKRLGYTNIQVKYGDGYYGWLEHAPYDAIVVTAAASHIPPPLLDQLKPGGKMIIPVGGRFMTQELLLIDKKPDGKHQTRQILPVSFVPFTREQE